MQDEYGRNIKYMRISVTDRCNLRCRYCMPEGIQKIQMDKILRYEQILDICRAAASLGIDRFKLTGGEPLARVNFVWFVGELKKIPGVKQVTMTTNGVLLGQHLEELKLKGLDCINISLDTLKEDRFLKITGKDVHRQVMRNIYQAVDSGIPIKINCVLQEGINDDEWEDLVELANQLSLDVRFIEMMPIGHGKYYAGVSNEKLLAWIRKKYPDIQKDSMSHGNGPAVYWKIPGWKGSIGFISAMNGKFCDSCNRIRLTARGNLKPCLCYEDSVDLKEIYADNPSQEILLLRLREAITEAIQRKPRGHCFESVNQITETEDMVRIGG